MACMRRNRLTASNFGIICGMQDSTLCGKTVQRLLYGKSLNTEGVKFGRINESIAIEQYQTLYGVQVQTCGLFIDKNNPFMGARPDGLVGENGITEVKCLLSVGEQNLKSAKVKGGCYQVINGEIR
ncbi:hypothetical protein ILUMI_14430 [Ignelater luminosus]|uniref:YqaJ viral recombinase domain-containing protein n=1 Tax=Ignelater luminosus TaxID=2038154 RepID=A0A8K0CQG1_IGNLU|nr:hypothetical protein ILUMI_14430 [Ignelater luminosus]